MIRIVHIYTKCRYLRSSTCEQINTSSKNDAFGRKKNENEKLICKQNEPKRTEIQRPNQTDDETKFIFLIFSPKMSVSVAPVEFGYGK